VIKTFDTKVRQTPDFRRHFQVDRALLARRHYSDGSEILSPENAKVSEAYMTQTRSILPRPAEVAASSFLQRLLARGVEYVFANAGTDFAPIIEVLSAADGERKYPTFVTVPHENLAMAMANGYYRVTGKPAAVMLHVTVGTANAICQIMNMARDNVPVLLCAGRTPATETGHVASRDVYIHWGQESFDQGAMLREYVKWDYELRAGQPIEALVDRALDIAMSEPRGPVYLALPREVLADAVVSMRRDNVRPLGVAPSAPSRHVVDQVTRMIAEAQAPLILTSSAGRSREGAAALSRLCSSLAIPVLQINATDANLPSDHLMNLGFAQDPRHHLQDADLVLVIECAVPWLPRLSRPRPATKVIHIGTDPLVSRHPFREFEADLLVSGDVTTTLVMLNELAGRLEDDVLRKRQHGVSAERAKALQARADLVRRSREESPIHPEWLAHCINEAKSEGSIIVNELGTAVSRLEFAGQDRYIGSSPAGGLGAGLGTALGAKLAAPNSDVIAIVGDGSYMFGNPVPFHYVQQAQNLPILTIVANNHQWLAVKQPTLAVYPDGAASKVNVMPVQDLDPSPAFERVAECCQGWAGRRSRFASRCVSASVGEGALRNSRFVERPYAANPITHRAEIRKTAKPNDRTVERVAACLHGVRQGVDGRTVLDRRADARSSGGNGRNIAGDLFGTATVSGMLRSLGRLPEITRAGQEPLSLKGGEQCTLLEGARASSPALCMAGFPVGFGRCAVLSRRRRPRVDVGCPVSPTHGTDQSRLGPHDQIAFCGFSGPKHLQD
jgi:acetolactate synthase I/II/III large subunit